jgi:t-SNARE complex subunit (syntaxin)
VIVIQWDMNTISQAEMEKIYHNIRKYTNEKIRVLPKNLWVLQDVNKDYLLHLRDKIDEIIKEMEEETNE